MGVTARDRSLCDCQGCLVVPSVRSDREVSELRERIDSAGLWDGAPGSTSHNGDLLGLGGRYGTSWTTTASFRTSRSDSPQAGLVQTVRGRQGGVQSAFNSSPEKRFECRYGANFAEKDV
jgi:hypothetical protein